MRHNTTGLSVDDLSRLTGSSSNTSSALTTPSHDTPINGKSKTTCSIIQLSAESHHNEQVKNLKNFSQHFNSSYLPEIIDPCDWQKSRKRKERQDSTSSSTQERKLVRSNSEELIPNADYEVIRRVSSSEDFKRPLQEINDENLLKTIQENECHLEPKPTAAATVTHKRRQSPLRTVTGTGTGDKMTRHSRLETSPARSHRHSPSRDYRKCRDSDESECENERRRSSERFCKSRAPPGRKAGVMKKSGKYMQKFHSNDENAYKYNISALKHERRGFISKFKIDGQRKEETADGEQIAPLQPTNDYNDNNLIDFHHTVRKLTPPPPPSSSSSSSTQPAKSQAHPKPQQQVTSQKPQPTATIRQQPKFESSAEALPWDSSIQHEDQVPVLCRRFEDVDTVDSASTPFQAPPPQVVTNNEPVKSFRTFTKMENIKTREIMQQSLPSVAFQTPEERLKQINKKLTALKKRIGLLEESYEKKNGYRPSQIEKLSDKQIKSALAEMNKLRKEKQDLKSNPMSVLGMKISGGMDEEKRLEKMKESLVEIEKRLNDKRHDSSRSECLDELTAEQLVQEKTSVQHALLYFESLYGRPSTKDERDIARPLYDRYRLLKRMVTRSITLSGSAGGASELPTILEHEAMAFTLESFPPTSVSTDSASSVEQTPSGTTIMPTGESFSDSSCSTLPTEDSNQKSEQSQQQQQQPLLGENIHTLSVDELWEHLEKARDEKRELKRIIREYETIFEEQSGRKMLKNDRKSIEDTYAQYKEQKAKVRLLQALIKKQISR